MEMRTCTGKDCGKTLPLTAENFYRHPTALGGFMNRCKSCHKRYNDESKEKRQAADERRKQMIARYMKQESY